VAGESTTVRSKAAGMAATTGRMTSAVLRRKQHRSQQESERRDENWPVHTVIICLSEVEKERIWYQPEGRIRTLPLDGNKQESA
jgi:hypothetical protein